MGFWSKFGKVASIAAPIIAAPFTGGTSLLGLAGVGAKTAAGIGSALGVAGNIAGAASAGRAQGRVTEAGVNQNQDQLRLQAARLNLDAPGQRAQNSVRGDILAGAQPLSINGPITHTGGKMPQISGGLSPSLFSDNTRNLGKDMSRQALLSQMQGDAFTPTPLPQAGKLDTFLNTIGGVGNVMGALGAAAPPHRIPQIPNLGRVDPMQLPGFQDPRKQLEMAGGF